MLTKKARGIKEKGRRNLVCEGNIYQKNSIFGQEFNPIAIMY